MNGSVDEESGLPDEAELARTDIEMSFRVRPLGNVVGDLSGILGAHATELVGAFYPRRVSNKVNVVLTELVNNVLQNFVDRESDIQVTLRLDAERLVLRVSNAATPAQYDKVRGIVERIQATPDPRTLLRDTIRERRKSRLRGGLGLLRLVVENKFQLGVSYDQSVLTVESRIALGGLA
ncbi:MAG: ATP-binding protein [Myxococcales bacterium]|nr:ATP-binding protein [Myxococcales bacterium]